MLTRRQAEALAARPYDRPLGAKTGAEMKAVRELAGLGLLERDPHGPRWRATAAGTDVLVALRRKGWLPW